MPDYTVFATVPQTRAYSVEAENMEAAMELVREEYNFLEYDIIDDEIDGVSVEE